MISVRIPILNEERLISHMLPPILSNFDDVIVIDLGSEDGTLRKLKKFKVRVEQHKRLTGKEFTALKNKYSNEILHRYAFWVDGDEIYEQGPLDYLIGS